MVSYGAVIPESGATSPQGKPSESSAAAHQRRVIECPECGAAHYWCDACRRAACRHVADSGDAAAPASPPTPTSSMEALRAFVAWVLAEIKADAELAELAEVPEDKYAFRVAIPGEVPKTAVIPRCLIDSAVTSPLSLRTLRNILQADILAMTHTRIVSDVRATRSGRLRRLVCSVCFRPIGSWEGLRLQQGDVVHPRCAPR